MRNRILPTIILILAILAVPFAVQSETVDVLIKGIYGGAKTNRDAAYAEALMNAKLQAIERAGTEVSSITQVENFTLKYDLIESKARAVILPGFQVIDMGYQTDGTYQVVFSGKVQVGPDKGKLWAKLRREPQRFQSFKEAFEAWQATFPGSEA